MHPRKRGSSRLQGLRLSRRFHKYGRNVHHPIKTVACSGVPLLACPAVPLEATASKLAVAPEYVTGFVLRSTQTFATFLA